MFFAEGALCMKNSESSHEDDMPATPFRVFNGVLEVLSHLLGGELGAGSQQKA